MKNSAVPSTIEHHNTIALDVSCDPQKTDRQRLEEIRGLLRDFVVDRMRAVHSEAVAISSDLDALRLRIEAHGHAAEIEDIKSARWYRTKSQLLVGKKLYAAVCSIMGVDQGEVRLSGDEEEDNWGTPDDSEG